MLAQGGRGEILNRVIFAPNKQNHDKFSSHLAKALSLSYQKKITFLARGCKTGLNHNIIPLQYRKSITKMPYLCNNSCSNSGTTVA